MYRCRKFFATPATVRRSGERNEKGRLRLLSLPLNCQPDENCPQNLRLIPIAALSFGLKPAAKSILRTFKLTPNPKTGLSSS